jgi:hypothetical protein
MACGGEGEACEYSVIVFGRGRRRRRITLIDYWWESQRERES